MTIKMFDSLVLSYFTGVQILHTRKHAYLHRRAHTHRAYVLFIFTLELFLYLFFSFPIFSLLTYLPKNVNTNLTSLNSRSLSTKFFLTEKKKISTKLKNCKPV